VLDEKDALPASRKGSIDDDFEVEGECFVYSTTKTVFTIEIR
jgi:hypothetical protein